MEVLHKIDLGKAFRLVNQYKWKFVVCEAVAIVIALVYGFSIPRTYKAQMKLAPESAGSGISGNLGSIGSMFGMKLGNLTSEDAIYPELYPDVKSSPDFLLSLYQIKVRTLDGEVCTDYKTYLQKYCQVTWWEKLFLMLKPKKVEKKNVKSLLDSLNVIYLSRDEHALLKGVDAAISCVVDKKTDVITISVIDQDPLVATIMVDSVSHKIQDFITDYRTKKARNDVAHLKELQAKALNDYEKAKRDYASFSDAHQDLYLESYKVKGENLEDEMQNAYSLYSNISTQLQMAEAKVLERTPVYTVIEAPMVPTKHIAPRRSIILLGAMFLAFIATFIWVYKKDEKMVAIQQVSSEEKSANEEK